MSRRAVTVGVLASLLSAGLMVVTVAPAAAQGDPVGGVGNTFFFHGAGNTTGAAVDAIRFGDPADVVYFGNFIGPTPGFNDGIGKDSPMVRRGNTYFVQHFPDVQVFVYGDPGDQVLVGDWDGDGRDTLAVRRGNRFFVRNSLTSGPADHVFSFGDPGDTVLVGNWDGDTRAGGYERLMNDTLAVRRGNHYFVKNSLSTGTADYDFFFGDPGDTVLVGDWSFPPPCDVTENGRDYIDGADQLTIKRGNVFFDSDEIRPPTAGRTGYGVGTRRTYAYGDPGDIAFVARRLTPYASAGGSSTPLYGDGVAVRRDGVRNSYVLPSRNSYC